MWASRFQDKSSREEGLGRVQEQMEIDAECVGDVVVLVEQMKQMNLPDLLDQHIRRHQREEGLSWGWVLSIWLAYTVSQGDHRKLTVREWVRQTRETLTFTTGREIRELDFTDDRLTIALRHLSNDERWNQIEQDLGRSLIRVYDLPQETLRVDATTVSGYREGGEDSLWQFGHSKDDPTLRQVKVMMAALDPLGLPIATDIVAGQHSDDGLYVPALSRTLSCLQGKGKLVVGDCKMSATATRAYLQGEEQYYLTPLSQVGEVAKQMPSWIETGVALGERASKVLIVDEEKTEEIARGYELKRWCTYEKQHWEERVLVVQSLAWARALQQNLEKRLEKATAALLALTPPVGQGRRQIKEEKLLVEQAEGILEKYEVTGLLIYTYERECRVVEKLVGRGRNGPNRDRQVIEQVRYQIMTVRRNDAAIAKRVAALGWRAYVTNAPQARLPFEHAVLEYRNEYRVERDFGRFKGERIRIAPMFVKRDDQVKGLTRFLSIAVRLFTLMDFVPRRTLKEQKRAVAGLYLDSPSKTTTKPTAERLLRTFLHVKLIIIYLSDRIVYQVKGFSHVHQDIVELLGLPPDCYTSLNRTVLRVTQATAVA
jgi:transposase